MGRFQDILLKRKVQIRLISTDRILLSLQIKKRSDSTPKCFVFTPNDNFNSILLKIPSLYYYRPVIFDWGALLYTPIQAARPQKCAPIKNEPSIVTLTHHCDPYYLSV